VKLLAGIETASNEALISWKGELCRKGIHLLSLIIPACFFILDSRLVISGLIIGCAFFALFDILRFFGTNQIKKFMGVNFGFLLRPREEKSFSGATTILLAGLLVYIFYDIRAAAASMVIIVIGDTAAALIGRSFGRIRFYNKSLEGTSAFILFALLFVQFIPGLPNRIAIIGVVVGAIMELLPVPIDDNITVPLIAGGFMQLLINQQLMM
jgi:dolichol kinase